MGVTGGAVASGADSGSTPLMAEPPDRAPWLVEDTTPSADVSALGVRSTTIRDRATAFARKFRRGKLRSSREAVRENIPDTPYWGRTLQSRSFWIRFH